MSKTAADVDLFFVSMVQRRNKALKRKQKLSEAIKIAIPYLFLLLFFTALGFVGSVEIYRQFFV